MGTYRVTSPYALLKVKDANGVTVVQGYYMDGVVTDPIEDAQFEKHVRNGWVEKADAPAAAVVDEPVQQGDEKPAGNASRPVWADYAKTQGATAEELAEPADGGLSRDELRELYG